MQIVLDNAALLLVDVQRDALHPDGALGRAGQAPDATEASRLIATWGGLIDLMREAGRPIVWVKTSLRPDFADSTYAPLWLERRLAETGPSFIEGSWGAELMDGLDAAPDDYVVVKKGHSAYDNTHLDRLLTNLGVTQCIVVGGGVTDSIAETARTGGRLGYEQFVVEDALYPPNAAKLHAPRKQAEVVLAEDVYAAASAAPPSPRPGPDYAMVLVDMQNDFMNAERPHVLYGLSDPMPEEKRVSIVENTQQLSAAMRERGWPVVYVRVVRRQDNSDDVHSRTHRRARTLPPGVTHCAYGTWGAEMVDELRPEEDDYVVEKKGGSGFGYTPLHRILRNLNAQRLIMTGGAVTGCVWATALDGVALGYDITVIADATYPPDSPDLPSLAEWCSVRPTAEVLANLGAPTAAPR
ncbi:MAG: cysteine hydrolase [Chloroflexi bacterium]|nr:cysteine hydrolase [Chloroflexota bacterium]MYF65846.1 cysteine hydrolase [Chloroflexota bacterium]MYK36094.1 cysteine hydrolase [Chloroflexota bacterium]